MKLKLSLRMGGESAPDCRSKRAEMGGCESGVKQRYGRKRYDAV